MSIMYCEKHDRRWDSDKLEECPLCETEQPRPSISAERVGNTANRMYQIFKQRHTDQDVIVELLALLREAGVEVTGGERDD